MKDLHVKVLSSDVCSMVGGWSIHRAALILIDLTKIPHGYNLHCF